MNPQALSAVPDRLTSRTVLTIAVPMAIANVSAPLTGAIDTAVIGQTGQAHLIGAVALGSTIFTLIYWGFGFLKIGTAALTAQASGRQEPAEIASSLARALLIALAVGLALILLQRPIAKAVFWFLEGSEAVEREARILYDIRIWSAPAALANYALTGWFLGLRRAGTALMLQIGLNLCNTVLNFVFVLGLGWGVAGVAAGTVIAEWSAALAGLLIAWRLTRTALPRRADVLDTARLKRLFAVNRDVLIRTFCLLAAFTFFTAEGARMGDVTLAANAVLMHFFLISAYLLEGFESAAQTLVGQAVGAGQRQRYRKAVWLTTLWSGAVAFAIAALIWLSSPFVFRIMTTAEDVRGLAAVYLPWAALTPIAGFAAFQLDGIFIGATRTADMRNMMIVSLAAYFAAWAVLTGPFGNHGLWAAMIVFFVVRAFTLLVRLPALERAWFGRP